MSEWDLEVDFVSVGAGIGGLTDADGRAFMPVVRDSRARCRRQAASDPRLRAELAR